MSSTKTIWVIDDNDEYRETICAGLQMESNLVASGFRSVEDALRQLSRTRDVPQVILLDIGLSGMSGIEAMPLILSKSPTSRIIMLTVDGREESIVKALRCGASGYVQKCEGLNAVAQSIRCTELKRNYLDSLSLTTVVTRIGRNKQPRRDFRLSLRESEIVQMIVAGMSRKEIASRLHLGYGTVISHYENIYKKLNVHKLSDLVSTALREGLVENL